MNRREKREAEIQAVLRETQPANPALRRCDVCGREYPACEVGLAGCHAICDQCLLESQQEGNAP